MHHGNKSETLLGSSLDEESAKHSLLITERHSKASFDASLRARCIDI